MKKTATLHERFMSHVITDGFFTHWLWDGALSSKQYGSFWIPAPKKSKVRGHSICAHRAAYELFVGPIPPGLEIDHICEVSNCVNPAHLQPITGTLNNFYRNVGRQQLCFIQPYEERAFWLLEKIAS